MDATQESAIFWCLLTIFGTTNVIAIRKEIRHYAVIRPIAGSILQIVLVVGLQGVFGAELAASMCYSMFDLVWSIHSGTVSHPKYVFQYTEPNWTH